MVDVLTSISGSGGTVKETIPTAEVGLDIPLVDHIYRLMDTVGDGSGTKNAIGDYSTPTDFKIMAPPNYRYHIHRVIGSIRDAGVLSADEYGALPELSNGVQAFLIDEQGNDILDLTDGVPITTNVGWARMCYDVDAKDYASGDNFMAIRWTFRNTGAPLILHPNESLAFRMRDNLTGLKEHYWMAEGFRISI